MSDENKENKIEKVKNILYSQNTDGIFARKRHPLKEGGSETIPSSWGDENEPIEEPRMKIPYKKILIWAAIFFLVASAFAFLKFFIGTNSVSGDNIDILVSGPTSIAGGEVLPLDIEVKNKNVVDLQTVDLRIEYPDGTKDPNDPSTEMKRYSEVLGNIGVGGSEKRLIRAILFGQENTEKTVKIRVEYRISGSNAIFSKEKNYTLLISSSPVNIKVTGAEEVNANQQTDFLINVSSNSLNVLRGLVLKIDYPFGFNLVSANPKPITSDNSVFSIGDLEPGAQRTIRVTGMIQGQDGEERVLRFTVGTPEENDKNLVGTAYSLLDHTVTIKKSFVDLSLAINQDTGDEVAVDAGNPVHATILWKNNLPEKIYDMIIKIKLSGNVLNKSSVSVSNGFYNSSDNTITFDKNRLPALSSVEIDDEGSMNFDFSSLSPFSNPQISFGGSEIVMDISVLGTRAGGSGGAQETLYSKKKLVKLSSSLRLLARGFRTVGPFENVGPFPPKVDQKTTYTITWTASNSFNNVNNVKATAILPPGVSWEGFTSPDSEYITYDQGSGQVSWDVGTLKAGAGTSYTPKDVSFLVSITPSITQVGQILNLLNESTISGTDAFTGARIGEVKSPVTTNITSDPQYTEGIGKVVQ